MKLLTHNMLQCHIKGVKNGYPFKIKADKVEVVDADFDADFLKHIFPRIQWKALVEGAAAMGASSEMHPRVVDLAALRLSVSPLLHAGSVAAPS